MKGCDNSIFVLIRKDALRHKSKIVVRIKQHMCDVVLDIVLESESVPLLWYRSSFEEEDLLIPWEEKCMTEFKLNIALKAGITLLYNALVTRY